MIRIFRAVSNAGFRAEPAGTPLIEAPDPPRLRAMLDHPSVAGLLVRHERATILQATDMLEPRASADIVVYAEGSVYRTVRRAAARAPSGPTSQPVRWLAADRESPVLLVEEGGSALVLRDALRFVGYNAEALIATPEGSIAEALRARDPLALVLGAKTFRNHASRLIEQVSAIPALPVVAVAAADTPAELTRHSRLDGVLEAPIRLETVCHLLDPLLARARRARSAGERPTGAGSG